MTVLSVHPVVPLLSDSSRTLWWGAVIGGFVVVLAVAGLLTILVAEVRTIDRRVAAVKETLKAAERTPRTPPSSASPPAVSKRSSPRACSTISSSAVCSER